MTDLSLDNTNLYPPRLRNFFLAGWRVANCCLWWPEGKLQQQHG